MFLYQVGQFGKTAASGLGVEGPPFAFEGLAGGGDGDIDIFLGSFMNGDDGFLVGRVDGFKGLAVNAFDPFVVDESEPRLSAIWGWEVGSWTMTEVPLALEGGLSTVMVEEDLQAGWLLIFPRGRGLEGLGKRHDGGSVLQQTAGCTMSCNLYRKGRLVRRKARCRGNAKIRE